MERDTYYIRESYLNICKNLLSSYIYNETQHTKNWDESNDEDASFFDDLKVARVAKKKVDEGGENLTREEIRFIEDLLSEAIEDDAWYGCAN